MNAGSTVAFGYEGTYDRNVSFKAKTDTQKATYNPEFNQLITFTEFVSFQKIFFFRVVKLKEYFISKKKKKTFLYLSVSTTLQKNENPTQR